MPGDGPIVGPHIRNLRVVFVVAIAAADADDGNAQTRHRRGDAPIVKVREDTVAAPRLQVGEAIDVILFHVQRPLALRLLDIRGDSPDDPAIVRELGSMMSATSGRCCMIACRNLKYFRVDDESLRWTADTTNLKRIAIHLKMRA